MRKPALLLLIGLLALAAAGCGSDDDEAADTGAATTAGAAATGSADDCAPESLQLVNDGMLTVGTDNPAFPPWFDGGTPEGSEWEINDPSTGEGFESAVAYAVAEKLGFAKDDVQWIVVPFNNSFRPGPKDFDFDINQISVTDERDMAVDFSDSYYDVNQALVGLNGTPIADATSRRRPEGRAARRPGRDDEPRVHRGHDPAGQGAARLRHLERRRRGAQREADRRHRGRPPDGVLPRRRRGGQERDRRRAVPLDRRAGALRDALRGGNPLRDCVNGALTELRDDGTLEQIQQEWLSEKTEAPILE